MAEKPLSATSSPEVYEKVVLVCRGEQRKPVSFRSDGTPREREALHAAVNVAYGAVAENPVIQMKSEQWDGVFVDLGEEDVIPDRAVLRIVGEVAG